MVAELDCDPVIVSPDGAVVVDLKVGFAKKARGLLTATGTAVAPTLDSLAEDGHVEALATAVIHDSERDVVAEVSVRWRIGIAEN